MSEAGLSEAETDLALQHPILETAPTFKPGLGKTDPFKEGAKTVDRVVSDLP